MIIKLDGQYMPVTKINRDSEHLYAYNFKYGINVRFFFIDFIYLYPNILKEIEKDD